MLEKIEELTLYTLEQHETIGSQEAEIEAQRQALRAQGELLWRLEARLAALEGR